MDLSTPEGRAARICAGHAGLAIIALTLAHKCIASYRKTNTMIRRFIFIVSICVAAASMAQAADQAALAAAPTARPQALAKTDHVIGAGKEALAGKNVTVHYTGWLFKPAEAKQRGSQFDSSVGRGPFVFPLGAGRVIKGWDQGVAGMKVGGKRTLIIPSEMAYGKRGAGGVIPPDADLIFDVDLLDVQ